MLNIEYFIANYGLEKPDLLNEEEIRYDILSGDVRFISGNKKIAMDWGWIPLLDFSYSLMNINNALGCTETGVEKFEFTESSDCLLFTKLNGEIKIEGSFSETEISIKLDEFASAVHGFYGQILNEIESRINRSVIDQVFSKYFTYVKSN